MFRCRRPVSILALLLACAGLVSSARAEVWGYIDADGTAHVATEKIDERYQLFFKGKSNADLAAQAAGGASADLDALRTTGIYKRMVDHPNIRRYQALIEKNSRARAGSMRRWSKRSSRSNLRSSPRPYRPRARWA
jgi:hypothetical protein